MKEKISCGLCQIYIEDGDDWEKHVNSKEHQQNLANLGGAKAIVERKMFADKIIGNNPEMKKAADKLFDDTNTKMKNILTGKKGFNIHEHDDLEKPDGFIALDGKWYSCDPIYHLAFASDYVRELCVTYDEKEYTTKKDFLIDHEGWMSVTIGLTDVYMQPSKKGITYAQKKILKKWLIKFKRPFHIEGQEVNDEFHNFFSEE